MTGTSGMNRRHNHHDISHNDYLGGTGIVKSKTSIALTGSSHRNLHGDIKFAHDKRGFTRSPKAKTGDSSVISKSGGSGGRRAGSEAGPSNHTSNGRKNSRQRQRPSDTTKGTSRTKPSKDDTGVESINSPIPSILPPISILQTATSKNGERSPRFPDGSMGNMPPSLSLAPTRLAIRQSTSPDMNNAINSSHTPKHVTHSNNNKINNHIHENPTDGVGSSKNPSSTPNQGTTKRSLASRNDTSNSIRLPNNNANINNTNTSTMMTPNTATNNTTTTSPPPRSPRLISESSRLSPINSHDKPKTKFEKKVMNTVLDNSIPSSPRAYRLDSSDTANNLNNKNNNTNSNTSQTKPEGKQSTQGQRRQSVKSLPKVAPPNDEQFSIRRKIEQFRKWHEEQHADNLKRLPTEDSDEVFKTVAITHNSRPSIPGLDPLLPTCSADVMDFAKLLEDKIIQNNITEGENEVTGEKNGETGEKYKEKGGGGGNESNENSNNNKKAILTTNTKGEKGVTNQNRRSKHRPVSGATWKTWRGVNDSDAYNDVNKYIHDNDLMDDEREAWIKSWIRDVGKAMSEMGDLTIDV